MESCDLLQFFYRPEDWSPEKTKLLYEGIQIERDERITQFGTKSELRKHRQGKWDRIEKIVSEMVKESITGKQCNIKFQSVWKTCTKVK